MGVLSEEKSLFASPRICFSLFRFCGIFRFFFSFLFGFLYIFIGCCFFVLQFLSFRSFHFTFSVWFSTSFIISATTIIIVVVDTVCFNFVILFYSFIYLWVGRSVVIFLRVSFIFLILFVLLFFRFLFCLHFPSRSNICIVCRLLVFHFVINIIKYTHAYFYFRSTSTHTHTEKHKD